MNFEHYCNYLYTLKGYRYTEFETHRIKIIINDVIEKGYEALNNGDEITGFHYLCIACRLCIGWSPGDKYETHANRGKYMRTMSAICESQVHRILTCSAQLSNNRDPMKIYEYLDENLGLFNIDIVNEFCRQIFDIHSLVWDDILYVYTQLTHNEFCKSAPDLFGKNIGQISYAEYSIYCTDTFQPKHIYHPKIIVVE